MCLPRPGIEVLKLYLVAGDDIALPVEDEEARGCGALVDAADKPLLCLLLLRLKNARWQVVLVVGVEVDGAVG